MIFYPRPKKELSYDVSGFCGGICNVCGLEGIMTVDDNAPIRSTVICPVCGSTNAERQLAHVLLRSSKLGGVRLPFLAAARWHEERDILSLNTGSLHEALKQCKNYSCASEPMRKGYDLIISCDVIQKDMLNPYDLHRDIFNSLVSGGSHVFTVPFSHVGYLDNISPGASVFSMEMLIVLAKIGFVSYIHWLEPSEEDVVRAAIHGSDAIVFEAVKP